MKRDLGLVLFGLLSGLLATGLLLLLTGRPRGQAVALIPPPTSPPIIVYVSGAVLHPGVYALGKDSRVQDAIQAAGGLLSSANAQSLNLAALLKDGDKLVIATLTQTSEVPAAGASRSQSHTGLDPSSSVTTTQPGSTSEKININTATLEELDSLPGIGPVIAQKIIDYRQEHGPYQSIEAIMDVSGIGPATFDRIKELITVSE